MRGRRGMVLGLGLRFNRNTCFRHFSVRVRDVERLDGGLRARQSLAHLRSCRVTGCRRLLVSRRLPLSRRLLLSRGFLPCRLFFSRRLFLSHRLLVFRELFECRGSRRGVRAEQGSLGDDFGDELLGFPAGGAVADGDDSDLMLRDHVLEEDLGVRPPVLGRMRIDDALVEEVSAPIEHRQLAAGPETGIDGQHDLLQDRWLKQQAAQVLGKNVDGVLLGSVGQIAPDLALHAGQDKPVQGIDRGVAE